MSLHAEDGPFISTNISSGTPYWGGPTPKNLPDFGKGMADWDMWAVNEDHIAQAITVVWCISPESQVICYDRVQSVSKLNSKRDSL